MKPCGQGCAEDILLLCEKLLGRKVETIEDLIAGWNLRREQRGLNGKWEFEQDAIGSYSGNAAARWSAPA